MQDCKTRRTSPRRVSKDTKNISRREEHQPPFYFVIGVQEGGIGEIRKKKGKLKKGWGNQNNLQLTDKYEEENNFSKETNNKNRQAFSFRRKTDNLLS